MTVTKAIKLLDYFLSEKTRHHEEIYSLERSFSQKDPFEIAQLIRKNLESELVILKMLRIQIMPKCKHPKKYQDKMKNGTLYCMNCNMDL
jgi:hypothetical protein